MKLVPELNAGPQIVDAAGVAGKIDYIIYQYLVAHYEQTPWRQETVAMYEMNLEAIAKWKVDGCPSGCMETIRPYAQVICGLAGSISGFTNPGSILGLN